MTKENLDRPADEAAVFETLEETLKLYEQYVELTQLAQCTGRSALEATWEHRSDLPLSLVVSNKR